MILSIIATTAAHLVFSRLDLLAPTLTVDILKRGCRPPAVRLCKTEQKFTRLVRRFLYTVRGAACGALLDRIMI